MKATELNADLQRPEDFSSLNPVLGQAWKSDSKKVLYFDVTCVETPSTPDAVIEEAYWQANEDIRAIGMPAAEHYRRYGQSENRKQAVNQDRVREIREEKLGRIRFRRSANPGRISGNAMNFLSDEIVSEFRIPPHPPVSSHDYGPFISDMQRVSPEKLFLDVGAGLRESFSSNMVNMDIFPAVSTDIVGVGEDMPFEDEQFDFVLCSAVLEHTLRPWDVAREICRVLKPGGTVRIDYPFLQPVHGYPNNYFNATPEGAVSLFEQYCDIEYTGVDPHNHPVQGLWLILNEWRRGLPLEDRSDFGRLSLDEILSSPASEHLDAAFCRNLTREAQRIIPAGSTLVAVKKPIGKVAVSAQRALEAENLALRHEVQLLRSSTSWRVTRPLRSLTMFLRRLSGERSVETTGRS